MNNLENEADISEKLSTVTATIKLLAVVYIC